MRTKRIIAILISLIAIIATVSCSGSLKNQSPLEPDIQVPDQASSIGTDETCGRNVLAVYDAVIDPIAKTFTVKQSERTADYHFPLSQNFPNVLQIVGYGFTPNFWADIKLKHPYPGSDIKAYDPRIIAILPANPGVSFNYPVLGVTGNNSVINAPDGYTKLFDNLGGSIPGNVNPFKDYFIDQPFCVWSGKGVTEETQRWNMNLSGFGGAMTFKLVVDVSTNYPNPPQAVIDNAPEPVYLGAFVDQGLTPSGGSALLTVYVQDWQGRMSIDSVKVEAPDLFTGTVDLFYQKPHGTLPDMYIYANTIFNSLLGAKGEYRYLVAATDKVTGIAAHNEFTVGVSYNTPQGNLIWAKSAGGLDSEQGNGITRLTDNSTVVTGTFNSSATFGENELSEQVLWSDGGKDIFIARYNTDGSIAWAKRAGGTSDDEGLQIASLSDDSIIITGGFYSDATFGKGEINETSLHSNAGNGIFIARYNPNGTLMWARSAGGLNGASRGCGVAVLADNSIIVTGYFYSSAIFGQGEINETTLVSNGERDSFLAKYNPNGTLVWAKQAGGELSDWSNAITAFSDSSITLTGSFYSASAIFGPGELNQTQLTSVGLSDIFIARYNSDGTLLWAKRAGGADEDCSRAVTSLTDLSTVITGDFYSNPITFGQGEPDSTVLNCAGQSDIFIASYNPDGTLAWAKGIGGEMWDTGFGITRLQDDSIVITGSFDYIVTFGLGQINETTLYSHGSCDVFVARYNQDGALIWVKSGGGGIDDIGLGITSLSCESTVITGYFKDFAVFGFGEQYETALWSSGEADILLARFEP
jgi:uncharacterized delta-60 repeat protein